MVNNYELFKRIRRDCDLTPGEKLIFLLLATYRNSINGKCCPGQRTLATDSGYSQRTVGRYIKSLQDKRKLGVNTSERRRSQYRFYPKLTHLDASQSDASLGASEQHSTTPKAERQNNKVKIGANEKTWTDLYGPQGEQLVQAWEIAKAQGIIQ